jgi:hypothetical protein
MRCPKCEFDHPLQTTECLKCGIVFAKYQAAVEAQAKQESAVAMAAAAPAGTTYPAIRREPAGAASSTLSGTAFLPAGAAYLQRGTTHPTPARVAHSRPASSASTSPADVRLSPLIFRDDELPNDARWEFKARILALPLALLFARLVARSPLGMLAMFLHESGHAITAWLTGRWAVPLLWVTMHGQERSWGIVAAVTAAILFSGYLAWNAQRWGWLCVAGAMLIVQIIFLNLPAESTIVFGGDGGAFVLGTVLMAMFYVPRESAIRKGWGLRWGLMFIGAISFMQVFLTWSGPIDDIPFGEIEGVNLSDPSLLTTVYGWSVTQMIDRYMRLATLCFVVLAGLYLWGLVAGYLEMRTSASASRSDTHRIAPNAR